MSQSKTYLKFKETRSQEDLTDKTVRLIFGDVFFVFAGEYNLDGYDSWEDTIEDLCTTYQELHEA